MSTLKKLISSVKILAICAVLILGLFSPTAMAENHGDMLKSISIEGGSFKVNPVKPLNHQATIRSAVVALEPANETGTIDAIVITGPDGKREFGCAGLKIKNGTDLIKSCGGPAILEPGATSYMAIGSGFAPNSNAKLSVDLKS